MTPADVSAKPVRERILGTARDLFYNQGYRATGINQIIEVSGVAKASLYQHFPTKSDLLIAYAQHMAEQEIVDLRAAVAGFPTARDRFFAPLEVLLPWFKSTNYRGCPFQNVMAEMPSPCQAERDPAAAREFEAIRAVARLHRENLRGLFRELFAGLCETEPRLAARDGAEVGDTYLLLFEGAVAASVAYEDPWPVERARGVLEQLIFMN